MKTGHKFSIFNSLNHMGTILFGVGSAGLGLLVCLHLLAAPLYASDTAHEPPSHGDSSAVESDHGAPAGDHGGGDEEHGAPAHKAPSHGDTPAVESDHGAPAGDHGGGDEEHGAASGHGDPDTGHGGGHHASAPPVYYVSWGLMLVTFFIGFLYIARVQKHGKPHHESLAFAFILVFMGLMLYAINQFPEVQRHFDVASHQFVDGYHESPILGFFKFLYKMALGICLTIYGLMGMEHH